MGGNARKPCCVTSGRFPEHASKQVAFTRQKIVPSSWLWPFCVRLPAWRELKTGVFAGIASLVRAVLQAAGSGRVHVLIWSFGR